MLGLMGPASRAAGRAERARTCRTEPSRSAPAREIEIGCYAVVRASRITYVGELGWELYVPAELARHVFDRIVGPAAEFG